MNRLLSFYFEWAARLAVRFKQHDRALELYTRIESGLPRGSRGVAAAVMAQGHVWGQKGDRARARAEFERALRIDPNLAVAHFNIGWVCDQQGLHEQALRHFAQALERNPDHDRAWYGCGIIHVKHGRHQEAKHAFKQVVRIEPMNMYGWYQLGMTHYVLGELTELEGLRRHTVRFNPKIAYLLDADIQKLKAQDASGSAGGAGAQAPMARA